MARGWWPWPVLHAWQDTHWGRCDGCGKDHWVVLVFTEHNGGGKPTGPFERLCITCLRRDGELPPLVSGSV